MKVITCIPVEKLSVGEVWPSRVSPAAGVDVERSLDESGRRRTARIGGGGGGGDDGGSRGLPLVAAQSSADQPDGVVHEGGGVERAATGRHRDQADRVLGQPASHRSDVPPEAAHHVLRDEPRVPGQEPVVVLPDHPKDDSRQHRAATRPRCR